MGTQKNPFGGPLKAVLVARDWEVTNDAGDPREEFNAFERPTEQQARYAATAINCHAELLAALAGVAGPAATRDASDSPDTAIVCVMVPLGALRRAWAAQRSAQGL
jgi:hypothetical protein